MKNCEFCDETNTEEILRGCEGLVFDKNRNNEPYLYVEHFRGEAIRISDVKYCPICGRKLIKENAGD